MNEKTRKMISVRLQPKTLVILDTAQTLDGTKYAGQTRTWLIENAIERVYGDLITKNGKWQPLPTSAE